MCLNNPSLNSRIAPLRRTHFPASATHSCSDVHNTQNSPIPTSSSRPCPRTDRPACSGWLPSVTILCRLIIICVSARQLLAVALVEPPPVQAASPAQYPGAGGGGVQSDISPLNTYASSASQPGILAIAAAGRRSDSHEPFAVAAACQLQLYTRTGEQNQFRRRRCSRRSWARDISSAPASSPRSWERLTLTYWPC